MADFNINEQGDFSEIDYDSYDFFTGKEKDNSVIDDEGSLKSFSFVKFFLDLLPEYFVRNDTYKDQNGRGFLIRYLSAFGETIEEELVPSIENTLNILDAQTTGSKFLIPLSDKLGNPPDIFLDESTYRNVLRFIVSFYKIKGTKKSYQFLFDLFNYRIELEELPILIDSNKYDQGGNYDSDDIRSNYDENECNPCSYYNITFFPKDIGNININQDIFNRLRVGIDLCEPINAKLNKITFGIYFDDSIELGLSDTATETIADTIKYDINNLYDSGEVYEDDGLPLPIYEVINVDLILNKLPNGFYELYLIGDENKLLDIDKSISNASLEFRSGTGNTINLYSGELLDGGVVGTDTLRINFVQDELVVNQDFSSLKLFTQIRLNNGKKSILETTLSEGNNQTRELLFF